MTCLSIKIIGFYIQTDWFNLVHSGILVWCWNESCIHIKQQKWQWIGISKGQWNRGESGKIQTYKKHPGFAQDLINMCMTKYAHDFVFGILQRVVDLMFSILPLKYCFTGVLNSIEWFHDMKRLKSSLRYTASATQKTGRVFKIL